ncbi:hypothetical protein GIS00_11870 [Nakamurella sp. YIM 132087]|uniref:DUF892 family protein n=1 Tax=Nakamurella alba TaxID=2665158 RepID=A0A7K1FKQ7_9ACTN|nr:hypothetical protein [Nakamurella alba]MTD14640.1 hypothetical protein [Nakamurella alba]
MPHLTTYLGMALRAEHTLAASLGVVALGHAEQADVHHTCRLLAGMSEAHTQALAPIVHRYLSRDEDDIVEPDRLHAPGLTRARGGQIGLLRDLQDLHVLGTLVQTTWTVLMQGAQGLRDRELLAVATRSNSDTSRQLSWFNTRMKAAAAQALLVAG